MTQRNGEERRRIGGDGTAARGARRALLKGLSALALTATAAPSFLGWAAPPAAAAPGQGRPAAPGRIYRFGVFPYLPALEMDRIFGPVAASLANDLGTGVHLRTKSTFERFAEAVAEESYDLIFVHPFLYVNAHDRHGYLPLARLDEPLSAVLMVAEDSPLRGLADLAGRTVPLPPELSAVSDLTKVALIDAGLDPGRDVTLRHYRTKPSCLQAVAIGSAAACGIPRFVFEQVAALGKMRLRPLFETPAVSHFVFAAHERLSEAERRALRTCILRWPRTEEGRAVMATGAWSRFVEAEDGDYDEVRRYKARLRAYEERRGA